MRLEIKAWRFVLAVVVAGLFGSAAADPISQPGMSRTESVLRAAADVAPPPGKTAYATIWDGDKYAQCHRTLQQTTHCETAGAQMQSSLSHVLTPQRVEALTQLGWRLDSSYGNYVRDFPAAIAPHDIAAAVLDALVQGYDANLSDLEFKISWIDSEPCPPRNGPSQNLAGMVNDALEPGLVAIHSCAYTPGPESPVKVLPPRSATNAVGDVIERDGDALTAQIARLRLGGRRRIFLILQTQTGYVQCEPQSAPDLSGIYCEAASADSVPELSAILDDSHVALLRKAGFAEPGRTQNYSKTYLTGAMDDQAIARELLTVLHDVYGYDGHPELQVITEAGNN